MVVKCVCRKYLAVMAGTYEEDAIEQTFGAPACELDCEHDCPAGNPEFAVIGK